MSDKVVEVCYSLSSFFLNAIFLIYRFTLIGWSVASSSFDTYQLPPFSFNTKLLFNNTLVNVFLMLNIVMGLMFLDNYLRLKKKAV